LENKTSDHSQKKRTVVCAPKRTTSQREKKIFNAYYIPESFLKRPDQLK